MSNNRHVSLPSSYYSEHSGSCLRSSVCYSDFSSETVISLNSVNNPESDVSRNSNDYTDSFLSSDSSNTNSLVSSSGSEIYNSYNKKQLLVRNHFPAIISKLPKKNLYELKTYINENNIDLKKVLSYDENKAFDKFNLLSFAIEGKCPPEIIKYLLKECTYECFKYEFNNKTPLILAIEKNNYIIADMLIKCGADINESNIIEKLQEKNLLNTSNLCYILNNGLKINNIDITKINEPMFLKIISKKYIFTNPFIFKLIDMYKKNKAISKIEFYDIIQNEKQKIKFCENHYENARNNIEKIILFYYDGSEEENMIYKIIKYDILKCAIELYINDYKKIKNHEKNLNYVKNILNYNALNFKRIISKKYMDLLNKSNEISGTISDISKLIIESTIKNFCIMDNKNFDSQKINYIINMAIKVDDEKMVKYLIEYCKCSSEIDINKNDINDEIVIIKALENEEIFKYLLKCGANVNTKDNNENSLTSLIVNNYPHLLNKLLLYKNISINEKSANGNCPIIDAIIKKDFESVTKLMTYGIKYKIDMNVKDEQGNTLLIISYNHGCMEIFNYLINYFDINEKNSNGCGILYYVLDKKDINTLDILLDENISINDIDNNKNSIFQVLINKGFTDTLLSVMKKSEIKANANLNHKNINGDTPLLTMIKNTNKDFKDIKENIIKDFIELGSNVNASNNDGETALSLAFERKSLSIAKILLKNGAKINVDIILKSIENNNASIFSCLINYIKIINLSKENKILILDNLLNKTFEYATNRNFIKSIKTNCMEMFKNYMKYLINNDYSNIIYESGVIKKIIDLENIELLDALIENGFDLSIKYSDFLPLNYAIINMKKKVFDYLFKKYYTNIYSNNIKN